MSAVVAERCCVQLALEYMEEFARERMCHRCVPCVIATDQVIDLLRKFSDKAGTPEELQWLESIALGMQETVMCKLGREAGGYLEETVSTYRDQFEQHINGRCLQKSCLALVRFKIVPEKCTLCGICKDVCEEDAIVGEKGTPFVADFKPFCIRDEKCTRCGRCLPLCEAEAIEVK